MKTLKDLTVEVKYRVGLVDAKIPQKVYDQLMKAMNNGDVIDPSYCPKYPEASKWLADNIKDGFIFYRNVQIEDIS